MTWVTWPLRALGFWLWFAKEIVVSNVAVLRDNLTPGQQSTPGIAAYSTRCRSDHELTLLASLITLTPSTLTLGTSIEARDDKLEPDPARVLYVHGMYQADADELREALADMEARMLHGIRREGFTA
ncbi:Na+/H+ antiporter subunit E [Humidisolicoccus flavus]|uniref:Na+/H+ antiporter subunit E n=1 Tax=Humidisolicoccus flavus TaxID=3111414 RepID=UPI00324799A4